MAKLSTAEEIALHAFSVRYRAAIAKKHPMPGNGLDTVKQAVREQYEQEKEQEMERTKTPHPELGKEPEPPGTDHER